MERRDRKPKLTLNKLIKELDNKFVVSVHGLKKKITCSNIKVILDAFLTNLSAHLDKGDVISIPNLGTFQKVEMVYKRVYDFHNNKYIENHAIRKVCFKTSSALKKRWIADRLKPEILEATDHHEKPQLL